jgi:predicted SprT family Zn-dependent metalloprotease
LILILIWMSFDLVRIFSDWNLKSFGGKLPIPEIRWNPRLKTSAGRFIPGHDKCIIEIAVYLSEESDADELIRDTVGHEMIHYLLWLQEKPYGHTPEFRKIMDAIGVSRYNPVPKQRPFKHCYECTSCDQKIFVRKRLEGAACAACCNQYSAGKYEVQYRLKLVASDERVLPLIAAEALA